MRKRKSGAAARRRRQLISASGLGVLARVAVVRGELEQAEQMAEETRSAPVGRLRINAPVSFGMNTLAPHLPRYIKEHSQVEVEPILSNRAVDQVDERYDAVFRVGELQDSGLIARVLAPYRLGVCAAPSYLCEHSNVNAGQEPPLFAGEVAVL